MKKKIIVFMMLVLGVFSLSACGSSSVNIADYLIEQRNNLFVTSDDLYSVTFSTGTREENYSLDGEVGNMVEFGIITLSRLDGNSLANDTYTYIITINDENFTGFLTANGTDNSYSADIEKSVNDDAEISIQITFTGYKIDSDLENVSSSFAITNTSAIEIANTELADELKEITEGDAKIEAMIKILKDYSSSDVKNYYWYIGIISTNGDTIGILIDANTGDIIAKKV